MSYARTAVTRMTLDMSRLDLQRSETVTQGDTNRRWEVTLINGGAPFRLPPNWTAALTGIKPDGNGLQNGCSVVDGKIVYDFAAGAEIATCAGNYPVQFDIWDETGELVASPKMYVNVLEDVRPYSQMTSDNQYTLIGELIGKVNGAEEDIELLAANVLANGNQIADLKKKVISSGGIVIQPNQWTNSTPYRADVFMPGDVFGKGCVVLFAPEDDATKEAAGKVMLSMKIDVTTDNNISPPDYVAIVRAESGTAPTIPLNFRYVVLKTDTEDKALVAMIGVDAVGAGGTGGGESENLRILITKIDGGMGQSSHTAQDIYEADVAERVIEAIMDGYRYEYLGATHFTDSGVCDEVKFYLTMVHDGEIFSEYITIYGDGTADLETITGGGTSGSGVDEAAVRTIINQVVPEWARASTKPTYNKDEVGLGNVDNVKQYSGNNPPDYPVDSVNGKTGAVQLKASDVGADPSGTAATKVSDHDTYTGSHNDIRLLIQELSNRLNAFLDTDDTTLDELSEIVAYIKSNKTLIDSITSSKVNVTDIINNLTTNVTNKPLSAAQGVALKKLIDALSTGKLDASALDSAIEEALAEAKASGDFKGDPGDKGQRGTGLLQITTAPSSYTTATGGFTPVYRIALSTVLSQAKVSEVLVGDALKYSYYRYPVGYVDGSYVYLGTRVNMRGATGAAGVSPTVAVTEIEGGHRVSVTDAEGTQTFDVMDGADGQEGKSAYQSWLDAGNTGTTADFLASLKGADGTTQVTPLYAESLDWLVENGEIGKLYVLPDGWIYAYFEKESTQLYVNRLPLATEAVGGDAIYNGIGYMDGYRVSATNGAVKACTGMMVSGFIQCQAGDIIRYKGMGQTTASYGQVTEFYDAGGTGLAGVTIASIEATNVAGVTIADGIITIDTSKIENASSIVNVAAFRFSFGDLSSAIVTVNQEIIEGGAEGGLGWNNTGHAFVPANYESRIIALEERMDAIAPSDGDIDTDYLRNWETPIYDANIPVFETEAVKPAKTNADHTPENAYALYDELMARYPQYITKTDLGLCSDGVHHLYQYDFKFPDTYHTGSLYSEKKPKAFLMSGIHNEYIAVYGLFYALEELVSNPNLRALLRNVHLIVLPCANPYAMVQSNNTIYLNANGVEIHRNFEVGFVVYDEDGGKQYSGATPLSEPESIVIDNIMKANKDMAFVLSAHSFGERADGKVMWCSAGTKYTCNLATRIINKLSDSWIDRFGDELLPGIESYAPENYANGDYRTGYVSISGTGGSEYRQAAKYGIQGFNFEVANIFSPHGTTTNKEPAYSSFGISRYAEVYANVLLTAFGVYDYKDKDKYVKYFRS